MDMTKGSIDWTFKLYVLFSFLFLGLMGYGGVAQIFGIIPACLIIYWIMCCCSQATFYIWNNKDLDSTYDNLKNVIS